MSKIMYVVCPKCDERFELGNWACDEAVGFADDRFVQACLKLAEAMPDNYWQDSEPIIWWAASHAECGPLEARDEYGDRYPCCGQQHTGPCDTSQ